MGLEPPELARLHSMIRRSGPLGVGNHLFGVGDRFTAIYAVRTGCIKSYSIGADGHELVHGFHLRGEVLGFDAVHPDRHRCNAVILEPSFVCVIPYKDIARLSVEFHSLHNQVLRVMSREFSRQLKFADSSVATQRIAAFLMDIHSRLHEPGSAEYEFKLPMSREDISNHLGIAPETLSRLIAKMHRKGLIDVDRRRIRLLNPVRLGLMAQGKITNRNQLSLDKYHRQINRIGN
jgi:CRP/FNR family transcriptional regulator